MYQICIHIKHDQKTRRLRPNLCDPAQRRKGLAQALLGALLKLARQDRSLEQILLAAETRNEAAKQLYRKFGFQTFGTEPNALKVGTEYADEEHMILRFR
jgi:ribosomal protein S18 acetylase RimI-like enzyme